MKVLIQGNCSLKAHVTYLQGMFPEWDVRGVLIPQANKWISEKNSAFSDFISEIDYFVGLTELGKLPDLVPSTTPKILVPSFRFYGFHPDCVGIPGIGSPLDQGFLHSRVISASFLAGHSIDQTKKAMTGELFEKLGYFQKYSTGRDEVVKMFKDLAHIDIEPSFTEWEERGCFMYCPPHPECGVFLDIFNKISVQSGLIKQSQDLRASEIKLQTTDYMETGIIWPVYPEIAEHLGIKQQRTMWRYSTGNNTGQHLDLEEFISASFKVYSSCSPAELDKMRTALGGPDGILQSSGISVN